MKQLLFSTIALKTNTKVVIDAKDILESSLTNNIVLVTSYLSFEKLNQAPLPISNETLKSYLKVHVDKGANMLRTSFTGPSEQSVVQLENQ